MPVFALLFLLFSQPVVAKTLPATDFQATHNFINKMVSEHHFNKNELLSIFSKVNLIVAEKKAKINR